MSKQWINFASGWDKSDDTGTKVSCNADWTKNSKNNKGQAYKVFVVPVDSSGEPNGDSLEVKYFNINSAGSDKSKYPSAPDFRVSMVVED